MRSTRTKNGFAVLCRSQTAPSDSPIRAVVHAPDASRQACPLSARVYGNCVLVGIPVYLLRRLQSVLNAAARLIMAALCNRADHYIFSLWLLSSSFFLLFFSPNLSGRRLDVYHTSTLGVALVRI